jgi:hypothetical protein
LALELVFKNRTGLVEVAVVEFFHAGLRLGIWQKGDQHGRGFG